MTNIGNRYEISSLTNDKVKLINSLHHRKYRREHNLFVAEGIRICREAAENGWEIRYLLYDNLNIDTYKIKDLIKNMTSDKPEDRYSALTLIKMFDNL